MVSGFGVIGMIRRVASKFGAGNIPVLAVRSTSPFPATTAYTHTLCVSRSKVNESVPGGIQGVC